MAKDCRERCALRIVELVLAGDAVEKRSLACGRSGLHPLLVLVPDAILRLPGVSRAELRGHQLQQRTIAPSSEPLEAPLHMPVVVEVHVVINLPHSISDLP